MIRTARAAILVVALGAAGSAQQVITAQDLSARLRPLPGPLIDGGVFEPSPGGWVPSGSALPTDAFYVNTCAAERYLKLEPGERVVDAGQAPSWENQELSCGSDALWSSFSVWGIELAYCTDLPSVDVRVTIHDAYPSGTDPAGLPGHTLDATSLPGSPDGTVKAFRVGLRLQTPYVFSIAADGDGTWDDVPELDTFGFAFEITNLVAGSDSGVVVAGAPPLVGTGCDFGFATQFDACQHEEGTGYGTTDTFALVRNATYQGSFYFGGWPAHPWSSFYLRLLDLGTVCGGLGFPSFCSGDSASCPCGNDPEFGGLPCFDPPTFSVGGCAHSGGFGARLTYHAGFPGLASADLQLRVAPLPVGSSGLFLLNSSTFPTPLAIFDGLVCVGGGPRLNAGFETSPGVRLSGDDGPLGPSLISEGVSLYPGFFQVGSEYYVQYWFRDVVSGPSPCGTGSNFSDAVSFLLFP